MQGVNTFRAFAITLALALSAAWSSSPAAAEWTHWRGPHQNGVADDTGLVAAWSKDGENLIWRDDFVGRSTPVVFDGRVCALGRIGEGIERQARAACWNAETGAKLWQRRYVIYHTDVPWQRVGWANLAADSETGYLFVHTVDGKLIALDRDGEEVWAHYLAEDFGRLSGYGGRTLSPIVDEDLVILGSIGSSWGAQRPPRHRIIAYDKRSGEIVYVSSPGGPPAGDLNIQSTPVIAEIDGQRLLIAGLADGFVHAIQARTGKPVWKYQLSKRGLNASVAVDGGTVFASHSEENHDTPNMGRTVALQLRDGSEIWRSDLAAGFPSPLTHGGRVYVGDNSANLHALDAKTGAELWVQNYGTVGKGSATWADGKIYLTEVNGNVTIVKPGDTGAEVLDEEHLEVPGGRYAEIYASPAIAYGRIYLVTEEGIYCLGDKSKTFTVTTPATPEPAAGHGPASQLQVVPADLVAAFDDTVSFRARAFDAAGNPVATPAGVSWSLRGLEGTLDGDRLRFAAAAGSQAGLVVASAGGLEATAGVRVVGPLPLVEDFEAVPVGEMPATWLPGFKGAAVQETEDGKVLVQPKASRGAPRAFAYIGHARMAGYTVQADVKGSREGRRVSDVGIINSGYTLDLQGAHQRLQVRSWASERRMAQQIDFAWEPGVWYTMKMRVDVADERATIRGKVWRRGESEPADWTITVEDPLPIRHGSPGIYTFAPVESYFDNVNVTVSTP